MCVSVLGALLCSLSPSLTLLFYSLPLFSLYFARRSAINAVSNIFARPSLLPLLHSCTPALLPLSNTPSLSPSACCQLATVIETATAALARFAAPFVAFNGAHFLA